MKISGFVVMSEPERLCYPYIESVKSFLPLCDEIVVVYNAIQKFQDGSLDKIRAIDPKVRVVYGLFDIERFGWPSQGIMRTTGYYACAGDIALMFDADGVLHENDVEEVRRQITRMHEEKVNYGFWLKHRFFRTEYYWRQCKHSGIYNKSMLGDNFNFYGGGDGKLAYPNWEMQGDERGRQLDIHLYGYEHLWDTKDILELKIRRSRLMRMSAGISEVSEEAYVSHFYEETRERLKKEGRRILIEQQPTVIQEKLRAITPEHSGFNLFQEL